MASNSVTTVGTLLVNDALPSELRREQHKLDKKGVHKLFNQLAENHPDTYKQVLHDLSEVGRKAVWTEGLSVSLASLRRSKAKERVLGPVKQKLRAILDSDELSDTERREAVAELLAGVSGELQDAVMDEATEAQDPFALQIISGARGKKSALNSIKGADLLTTDQEDRFVPLPILHSYAEGLTPAEYFATSYGQRRGQLDVKLAVGDAGFLTKQLVNATHRQVVNRDEPTVYRKPVGLPVDPADHDNVGAVLAADAGAYPAGTILTEDILEDIRDDDEQDEILIHSPMTEFSEDGGISAAAAGRRTRQGLHLVGDNVGIPAAQALGERMSQGSLDCLAEGTEVLMPDFTLRRIEELKVGDLVMGSDERGVLAPTRVMRVFDQGVQPCYRTSFKYGQTIVAALDSTTEHKCLVTTEFTNHSEQPFNHVPRKLPIGKVCRDLRAVRSQGLAPSFGGIAEPRAYLLGLLLGDGCYTESVHGVHFSCADQVLLDYLTPYLGKFNLRWKHLSAYYYRLSQVVQAPSSRDAAGRTVSEVRNPARLLLDEYDCYNSYAHEKLIPSAVSSWDNQSVAELLAGLIDSDGTVFWRKTRGSEAPGFGFCSTSFPMLQTVRSLLELRFGIYPSKTKVLSPGRYVSRRAKHTLYTFHCSDQLSVQRFAAAIPLHGVKAEKVRKWMADSTTEPTRKVAGSVLRVEQEVLGDRQCWDIEVDNESSLFVLANGLIVSNSKHSAGVNTRLSKSGQVYLNRLIQAPAHFPEAGPLSEEAGIVSEIRPAPQGGMLIKIGDRDYHAGPDLDVTVKVGDNIEVGDDLTDGTPHPAQLVKLRGMGEARRVYLKELTSALRDSGLTAHRRNVESVVSGLLNWGHVTDVDGVGDAIYDDIVPYGRLIAQYQARKDAEELDPGKAVGRYLEEPVLHYTPGTRITRKVADHLNKWKVGKTLVHNEPPAFEPHMVRGVMSVYHDPDWRVRQAGFYTARAFEQSLHRGLESDTQSTSYIPAAAANPAQLGSQLTALGKYGATMMD